MLEAALTGATTRDRLHRAAGKGRQLPRRRACGQSASHRDPARSRLGRAPIPWARRPSTHLQAGRLQSLLKACIMRPTRIRDSHARHDGQESGAEAYTPHPNFAKYHKLFPTTAWLRREAPKHVPLFSFEYGDTGRQRYRHRAQLAASTRQDHAALRRRRHTRRRSRSNCSARRYNAPIGIAPMGGPSLFWPGADLTMARAAQTRTRRAVQSQRRGRRHHRGGPPKQHRMCSGCSSTGSGATITSSASI